MSGWLQDNPAQFTRSLLAGDFELHVSFSDLGERAEISVGSKGTGNSTGSSGQGDVNWVFRQGLVVGLRIVRLQVEDERLIFFNTVDIVAGGCFIIAVEVVGLNDRLSLLLGFSLLGKLFLASAAAH